MTNHMQNAIKQIFENENLSKKLIKLETLDEILELFKSIDNNISKEDFEEGINELLEKSSEKLTDETLSEISGGALNKNFKKSLAATLAALSVGSSQIYAAPQTTSKTSKVISAALLTALGVTGATALGAMLYHIMNKPGDLADTDLKDIYYGLLMDTNSEQLEEAFNALAKLNGTNENFGQEFNKILKEKGIDPTQLKAGDAKELFKDKNFFNSLPLSVIEKISPDDIKNEVNQLISAKKAQSEGSTSEDSKQQASASESAISKTSISEDLKPQTSISESATPENSKQQTPTSKGSKQQASASKGSKQQASASKGSKQQASASKGSKQQASTSKGSKQQTLTPGSSSFIKGLLNPTYSTCHLNAVLQLLRQIPEVREGNVKPKEDDDDKTVEKINSLNEVMKAINTTSKGEITDENFEKEKENLLKLLYNDEWKSIRDASDDFKNLNLPLESLDIEKFELWPLEPKDIVDIKNINDSSNSVRLKNAKYKLFIISTDNKKNFEEFYELDGKKYELKSVVCYPGGHYYTYSKDENGVWYKCNDETIKGANFKTTIKKYSSYPTMFLYSRVDKTQN